MLAVCRKGEVGLQEATSWRSGVNAITIDHVIAVPKHSIIMCTNYLNQEKVFMKRTDPKSGRRMSRLSRDIYTYIFTALAQISLFSIRRQLQTRMFALRTPR